MVLLIKETPVSPMFVAFCRIVVAVPFLLITASKTDEFWRRRSPQENKVYISLGICMAVYQSCYFGAVSFAGITVAAFISICSSPLFIAILASQYLKEKLYFKTYLALGLGMTGTALFVVNPQMNASQNPSFFLGSVLALAAGFSYAIHVIIARASVRNYEPIQVVTFDFMVAALLLSPTLFFEPNLIHSLKIGWPFLLYLGLIPTGFAYILYFVGLRHTSATVAGIAVLLEPLTATLLGALFFNEPMGLISKFGALLLLVSIIFLTIRKEAL